jgi:glycosyltransferase involved in cell wall biosynthesis
VSGQTNGSRRSPSVALVHDYLLVMRGAERTFAEVAACWPEASIYTLLYDSTGTEGRFAQRTVQASYAQRLGARQQNFRRLAPVFVHAVRHLPVSDHDLVISSSSAFAHGVRVGDRAQHVCYCHSPLRYAWHERSRTAEATPWFARPPLRWGLDRFRRWDLKISERVDHYIANSEITRSRIQEFYGRDACAVVHPPVDVGRFSIEEPQDYFLTVGELASHKRVELALEAARRAGQKIKVVGAGPDEERLRTLYADCAQFVGRVSDAELAHLYAGALAFVMPNVEEFGIAAVEAQAAGRPVIAVGAGGALETVIDGETGVLVPPDDAAAIGEAMSQVDFRSFSAQAIRGHASQFSTESFRSKLSSAVAELTGGASQPLDLDELGAETLADRASEGALPREAPVPV